MTDLYSEWRNFYAKKVRSWMSLEELRSECGKLQTVDNPNPELLLIHAMNALEELQAEVLLRYRNEIPLGCQPHMLAHEVDDLLRDREESHEISGYTCTVPPSPKQRENKDE